MADNENDSFMARHFPDTRPLQQNKQAAGQTGKKPFPGKPHTAIEEFEQPALRLPGDSRIEGGDQLSYQANGVQNRLMRQLKQGKLAIEESLDLHGQTIEQAHESTMQFIQQCRRFGASCVLIIHGQGYRSSGGVPVLKQNVDYWLRQQPAVLAFHSALPVDGGRGAVYVLLRKGSK